MTLAAICLLLLAGFLRTRLGRLLLARWLIHASIVIGDAGGRVLAKVKSDWSGRP